MHSRSTDLTLLLAALSAALTLSSEPAFAQDRFTVAPWLGRTFRPTTVQVRTLPDGTRLTAEMSSSTTVGVDGQIRIFGGLSAGLIFAWSDTDLTGIVGDGERKIPLGGERAVTLAGIVAYRAPLGPGYADVLAGLGATNRDAERGDTDLTALFGAGLTYPLREWLGLRATARDQVSSYDAFIDTPGAAPATRIHEIHLTAGVELRL